jgi:NADPH:quinone reductase-like Zn-dependent oxidoreductase
MKAWMVRAFGGPEVLKWEELSEPEPGPAKVLVAVKASGVNFAETRMRAGTYTGVGLPFAIGMESAGIVEKVGPGVAGFRPGDRVMGRARGSHGTKVLFDAAVLMHLPANLSFEQGAAIPVGWHTAWHAAVTVVNSQPGHRVLIEAVASSVGSAVLQIVKHRGCWVAVTASRDDKLVPARRLGADAAYNYKTEDFSARVRADTGGYGIDIAFMTIGEETASRVFAALANGGKAVMYGSTGGRQICFDLGIGERNLQLLTMSITSSDRYIPETVKTFNEQALPLFASGAFRPVVDTVLPMSQLAKAQEMINDRRHFGKVILTNE